MRKKVEKPTIPSNEETKSGEIPGADNPKEPTVGESLGFGFVSFTTIEAASRARTESRVKPFKGQTQLFIS